MYISTTFSVSSPGCRVPSCLLGWREQGHLLLIRWRNSMSTLITSPTLSIITISQLMMVRLTQRQLNECNLTCFRELCNSVICGLSITLAYCITMRGVTSSVRSLCKFFPSEHPFPSTSLHHQIHIKALKKRKLSRRVAIQPCGTVRAFLGQREIRVMETEWRKPHAGSLFPALN